MDKNIMAAIDFDYRDGVDLNMYQCGIEACKPAHGYGPALRDHYLIHYILDGKGTFLMDHKTYTLSKGQGFLIPPNKTTYYQAHSDTPWTYVWVGFHGLKAEAYLQKAGLTKNHPIFTYEGEGLENYIKEMIQASKISDSNELRLKGLLFLFIAELVENPTQDIKPQYSSSKEYVVQAINFIENNYSRPIKIKDIAHNLSIDRSYFSNIFKEHLQKTPQQFLLDYRIDKACHLLKDSNLSIGTIAHSVGYSDTFGFSKIFKKNKGQSPSNYRKDL